MPSADFCHVIVSPYGSITVLMDTRQISRGKHASFRTRAPSIHAWLIMDRGLCRVLSAGGGSHQARLTRFLFITPCVCATLPQQGGFLPKHRRRYPVAIPLYPSPPSGWVWDLLNFLIQGKLSAPLRIRAVTGTQQIAEPDRENYAVLRKGLCRLESSEAGRLAQTLAYPYHISIQVNACFIQQLVVHVKIR